MKKILSVLAIILLFASCGSKEVTADFDYEIEHPFKVHFYNKSTNAYMYDWTFGDGDMVHMDNPIHKYPGRGVYKVTLKATGDKDVDFVSYNVTIEDPTKCFLDDVVLKKIPTNNNYYKVRILNNSESIFETEWKLLSSANIPYTFNIDLAMHTIYYGKIYICVYDNDNKSTYGDLLLNSVLSVIDLRDGYWESAGSENYNAGIDVLFKWRD